MLSYGIAGLAFGWVVLLLAAPFLPGAVSGLTYAVGSLICHQLTERSFHFDSYQLPVCARCLGLYAGGAAGALVAIVRAPARLPQTRAWALAVAAAVPTALTVALEISGVWYPANATRAIAGLPLGGAVAYAVVSAFERARIGHAAARSTVHYGECAPRRPTAPNPRPPSI